MKNKLILTVVVVLAVVGGGVSYLSVHTNNQQPSTQAIQTSEPIKTDISYKGVEGKNALELLKQNFTVETKAYDGLGELVTSIEGATPDKTHFWSFYINGQQAQVGANAYITKTTDTVSWKLEEIQ